MMSGGKRDPSLVPWLQMDHGIAQRAFADVEAQVE